MKHDLKADPRQFTLIYKNNKKEIVGSFAFNIHEAQQLYHLLGDFLGDERIYAEEAASTLPDTFGIKELRAILKEVIYWQKVNKPKTWHYIVKK